jgi:predicted ATPase/DNA-binding CsgD family transcriptional regulator/transcriptional regulator with XRE-family HTH domain
MTDAATVGAWLKQRRKHCDLTQDALAEQVGCAVETIRKIEQGTRRPSREIAERLATVLHLLPDERAAFVRRARLAPPASGHAGHAAAPPQAPAAKPAPDPSPALPALPSSLTPLIGREHEVAALVEQLHGGAVRLVTVVGPGGVGKTRVAQELASILTDAFADGVVWVPLAAVTDAALVVPAIAAALVVREVAGQPLRDGLHHTLQRKQVLLVLDNVEHLVAAAPEVAALLHACPHLTVLTTSRAPLHVRGEQEFPVAPLLLPTLHHEPRAEEVMASPAVQLFVARAQAVVPGFALTQTNAATVAAICRRLDGLPLALELAAARIKVLGPTTLLTRLDQALPLLTGGPRDLAARHQTLRDAVAWSYDLLNEHEQRLFRRLAVFVDGWTVRAAEAVAGEPSTLPSVFDGLVSLLDKSLVVRDGGDDGEPRFRMLETIRAYGQELLLASGELVAAERAHAQYYVALIHTAAAPSSGDYGAMHIDGVHIEQHNLRAALHWASTQRGDDPVLGLQLAGMLWPFWETHGYLSEGRRWLAVLLAATPPAALDADRSAALARAQALRGAGELAHAHGDYATGAKDLDESIVLWRALAHPAGLAGALTARGWIAVAQGEHDRARALYNESLGIVRTLNDQAALASLLDDLGLLLHRQGDTAAAQASYAESLVLLRTMGDTVGAATMLMHLGEVAIGAGDPASARARLKDSLALAQTVPNLRDRAWLTQRLVWAVARLGDTDWAAVLSTESIAHYRQLGDDEALAWALSHAGDTARWQGNDHQAAACYTESAALFRAAHHRQGSATQVHNLAYLALRRGEVAQAEQQFVESLLAFAALAHTWSIGDCLAGLAAVAAARKQGERGARLIGSAAAVHDQLDPSGFSMEPANRAEWDRTLALLRAQVPAPAFEMALHAGQSMTVVQALAYAQTPPLAPVVPPDTPSHQQTHPPRQSYPAGLTEREVEVLRLVATGLTNAEVARRLVISPRTVNAHLNAIYGKLGVTTRSAATRFALDHHLA